MVEARENGSIEEEEEEDAATNVPKSNFELFGRREHRG
jgi:hypothetical protein